ncbi:hypothetical protein PAC01_07200 [Pediococcus acidilactici]|nr:hypothetical protein PAC01_07200 [Pediococcus acidilactici]
MSKLSCVPRFKRYNSNAYRKRTNKNGFTRTFKEYVAEKYDVDHKLISKSLTPKGYTEKT